MGQKTVIICPVCGRENAAELLRCAVCWSSLAGVVPVPRDEAEALAGKRRAARRWRRLAPWGIAALLVVGVGAWIAFNKLVTPRLLPQPASAIGAALGPGQWPMYQGGPSHNAFVADPGATPQGELRWRFPTEAPISSSPAVVDGVVYLSTGDRRVVALDAKSGGLVWERAVSGPVDSSVAVAGGMVFLGLRDGSVLALDRLGGATRWRFDADGPVLSPPAVHRGVLYIGSGDFGVYALDAATGEKLWSYRTGGWVVSGPAAQDQAVAVTSMDDMLYIIDPKTGKPRMDFLASYSPGGPVFDGDRVFVATDRGALTAIDWRKRDLPLEKLARRVRLQLLAWGLVDSFPPEGGFVWGFGPPKASFIGPPVVAWGNVYVASATGGLFAVSRSGGVKVWEFRGSAGFKASPSVVGQTIFAGDAEGWLYAVDALTGEERWRLKLGGEISSAPVYAGGLLYVASKDGALYAVQ